VTSQVKVLVDIGGVFALLVFVHFVVDWLFQSHDEAMKKAKDSWVRARHCLVYTFGFIPIICVLSLTIAEAMGCLTLLFFSHLIEDTYYPVLLWAKYLRKPPEFEKFVYDIDLMDMRKLNDEEAFIEWASTPLGKIIAVVVDQLVHIAFLLPIAYYAVT
jgi:hypothetical protein